MEWIKKWKECADKKTIENNISVYIYIIYSQLLVMLENMMVH